MSTGTDHVTLGPYPAWYPSFDWQPEQAVATKRAVDKGGGREVPGSRPSFPHSGRGLHGPEAHAVAVVARSQCSGSASWSALARAVATLTALVLERERLLGERAAARSTERALRETSRRMGEFVSIASHELRSPLTCAKASVQMAQQQLDKLAPAQSVTGTDTGAMLDAIHGLLTRTDSQISRAARLVDDLLDLSRIEANHMEVCPAATDVAAIVREVVETHGQAWPARTLILDVPAEPLCVIVDADRIAQVVTNYVTNALKYSADDRPVVVSAERERAEACVRVCDKGPGLTCEQQQHVWDRFHRAQGIAEQDAACGSGGGLGLGLYISRRLIEQHGGRVGVESRPGAGSTFWFTLPLAHDEV